MANLQLEDEMRAAWHRYVDLTSAFRPELHRYCRGLTRDLWDAEDLVQESLLRAFATLSQLNGKVENPRGYLIRTATHLWIDTLRRRNTEAAMLSEQAVLASDQKSDSQPPVEVRDAGNV